VGPGAGSLLVLPCFSGGRAPINDPQARGLIAGPSLSHTREDLVRAVLEGVGYGVRQNIETFRALGSGVRRVAAVGGDQSDVWLQIVSDINGEVQEVPATTIGASYGDAFLAVPAAGLLERGDLDGWLRPGRTIRSQPSSAERYQPLY